MLRHFEHHYELLKTHCIYTFHHCKYNKKHLFQIIKSLYLFKVSALLENFHDLLTKFFVCFRKSFFHWTVHVQYTNDLILK